ncbi:fumarylacetoacetate hydrolase family protein [Kaistia dalseonensis]|uniref:Fumarylacetoacetate (FAA) hydrolase family protein n=1 Tax=Kaistia dalseonensis TaxID=410840 RepID=A0ABU0H9C7_9HYPH|nr:fumarylacetoacetate hydrolase family protein [Kaistia dalseonensis]MCX5496284.1 fumarylacetoacetate hydrolase family protein [Kaistia dalseonensis]MDQ0438902.1 fumarylacetoacetate (FAA) hydrolase family protein [Kaistia dalseonensis]
MPFDTKPAFALPEDADQAVLVGRVFRPDLDGPSVAVLRDGQLIDITAMAVTMRDLCESQDPAHFATTADGEIIGSFEDILANTPIETRDPALPYLIAPIDLQAVKAAGVTFVVSMLERVIEEQARGLPERAVAIRSEIQATIGDDLAALKPGSEQAAALKQLLIEKGMWSQYLEVGIGPDAEIFSKAQPMSAVGHLAEIGIHPISNWNNPEPEMVLVVSSSGKIVGATLGNDVNLRDVEGRSALLLSKAKDNNASASIGPMIRLFSETFSLDDVRSTEVRLTVDGEDGFRMDGSSAMSKISRDPEDLVKQTIGKNHQYPDGFVLYLGTMFAPVQDRDGPGQGFTHKVGDIVTIAAPKIGKLSNRVVRCPDAAPWTFGTGALMRNLAGRGLL